MYTTPYIWEHVQILLKVPNFSISYGKFYSEEEIFKNYYVCRWYFERNSHKLLQSL